MPLTLWVITAGHLQTCFTYIDCFSSLPLRCEEAELLSLAGVAMKYFGFQGQREGGVCGPRQLCLDVPSLSLGLEKAHVPCPWLCGLQYLLMALLGLDSKGLCMQTT